MAAADQPDSQHYFFLFRGGVGNRDCLIRAVCAGGLEGERRGGLSRGQLDTADIFGLGESLTHCLRCGEVFFSPNWH